MVWVKTLSRWAGTDRILVEEFNDNWDKIDTAMLGKKLLLDYTTEEEALTVEVPLTGVDWGSCAVAVIKITPSVEQVKGDTLWINFDGMNGSCRSLVSGTQYTDEFAFGSLAAETYLYLFVGRNSRNNITGLAPYRSDLLVCGHGRAYADKKNLILYNYGSGKTAPGTRIQIWGLG